MKSSWKHQTIPSSQHQHSNGLSQTIEYLLLWILLLLSLLFFFIPVCIYNLISVSTRKEKCRQRQQRHFMRSLRKTHSHRICSQFCLIANFQYQHQQHRFLLFCRQFFRSFVSFFSWFTLDPFTFLFRQREAARTVQFQSIKVENGCLSAKQHDWKSIVILHSCEHIIGFDFILHLFVVAVVVTIDAVLCRISVCYNFPFRTTWMWYVCAVWNDRSIMWFYHHSVDVWK